MEIKSITPIDFSKLIIAFNNGNVKFFSPEKSKLYLKYDFLAYPNKFGAFGRIIGKKTPDH